MRLPQTWRDKSLLEDEPFLSAFKARQIAAPPTRRGAALAGEDDDDARNDAIVRDIRDMNLVGFSLYLRLTSNFTDHSYQRCKAGLILPSNLIIYPIC